MKKKLLLTIFVVFMGFIFINNINAQTINKYIYSCTYIDKDATGEFHEKYELNYQVAGNTRTVVGCTHHIASKTKKDCSNYTFDFWDVASDEVANDCPSSISVKGNTIKGVKNYKGDFVHKKQWWCAYTYNEKDYYVKLEYMDKKFSIAYVKENSKDGEKLSTDKYELTQASVKESDYREACPYMQIKEIDKAGTMKLRFHIYTKNEGLGFINNDWLLEGKFFSHKYRRNRTATETVEVDNRCYVWGNEGDCKSASGINCVWNKTKYGNFCNVNKLLYVYCGDAKDIPSEIPEIVSFAVNFLKILTPIILIFMSIITLLKAISSSNEDEMKKAQKGIVRKIIAAVMVFFITSIVQFVIMKVADDELESDVNNKVETKNLSKCLNCFLNNECERYFKVNINGKDYYKLL